MNELNKLYKMADKYNNFSCKPINKKYKTGTIFDEDKSVKWNREEVIRRNELHDEEVKKLNKEKNELYTDFVKETKKYIISETNVSKERATKIYNYLYSEYHSYGLCGMINHLDELLEIFQ